MKEHSAIAQALRPLRNPAYAVLWTATVVTNIGWWMYTAAAAWLMTDLSVDPWMVSLVQVSSSLPMFLFALPAGALASCPRHRREHLPGARKETSAGWTRPAPEKPSKDRR